MEINHVLITGPTGCVGLGLMKALLKRNIHVTAVVRPHSDVQNRLPKSEWLDVVSCDLSNLDELKEHIQVQQDVLFHLGWSGTYGQDRMNEENQMKNVGYTLDAVLLAEALHAHSFVFVGSQSEYGPVAGKMSEEMESHPETPYGKAKLQAEEKSYALCKKLGIRFVGARLFSVYGPGDKPYTMVMSTLKKMLDREELTFTPGEQLWDYLYAEDAGEALTLLAEKGISGNVYNVANGSVASLRSYIETMQAVTGTTEPLQFGALPYYPNQVMRLEADISKLQQDTGFVPQTSFQEGIQKTIDWLKA